MGATFFGSGSDSTSDTAGFAITVSFFEGCAFDETSSALVFKESLSVEAGATGLAADLFPSDNSESFTFFTGVEV